MGKYFLLGFFVSFFLLGSWDTSLLLAVWKAVRPVFAGVAVAAFLWPICCFFEEKLPLKKESFRRGGALCLLAAGVLLLVILFVWLLIPALRGSMGSLMELSGELMESYGERFPKLQVVLEKGWSLLASPELGSRLGEAAGSILDLLTGVTVAFLMLFRRQGITATGRMLLARFLGEKFAEKTEAVLCKAAEVFGRFFLGQLTEALVIGSGCLLFLLAFSFPYGAEIALLMAVTAIIPVAGAIVGTAVGCLILLTDSLKKALIFLVFMLLLQWVENLVIYPKVVGKTVGLSSLGTLTAVIVGGKLFGAAGVLIFVPVLGTVKAFRSEIFPSAEKQDRKSPTI